MEEIIKIMIRDKHLKQSHGYIFDDCPLKLAIQEVYPDAFISVGGPKVIIILDKKNDKITWNYKPSSNYGPYIDQWVVNAKHETTVWGDFMMEVTLTLIGTEYNYYQHEPNHDYIKEESSTEEILLPENLFGE